MITIKPSAAIREKYSAIPDLCKRSGDPVYPTKNRERTVVVDIASYARRESMDRLRESLVIAEESRLQGNSGHSVDDVSAMMKAAVREMLDEQRK